MKTRYINAMALFLIVFFLSLFPIIGMGAHRAMRDIYYYLLILIACGVLLATSKVYASITEEVHDLENHWHIMASVFIGSVATFVLNIQLHWGAVLSAAAVGVLGGYLPGWVKLPKAEDYAAPVYCGAFVGMSSALVLSNLWLVVLASFLASVLFVITKNVYLGVGGKLGTIAFMAVTSAVSLSGLMSVAK